MTQINYKFLTSLFTISVIISIVESLIMWLLKAFQEAGGVLTGFQEAIVDMLLLVLISTPILWFVVLRPLIVQITQKQQTTEEQSRLNAELRNALNTHALVSIADAQGLIIYVNDNFCEVSGYSSEELLGKNHRIVNSGYHDEAYIRTMWQTITQGQIWQGVFCNRNKNGALYWVDSTITPLLDDTGKPYQYVSIRQDITAKKAANEELMILKQAVDACSEMILISDNQGVIQYANPALYQLTGWTESSLVGLKTQVLDSANADEQTLHEMANVLTDKKSWSGRVLERRKGAAPIRIAGQTTPPDNLEFWAELSITPVFNSDGSVTGYVQIQRDMTEKIVKEAALQMEKHDTAARLEIAEILQQAHSMEQRFSQVLDILFELKGFDFQRKGGVFLQAESGDYLEMFVLRGEFSEQFIAREKRIPLGACLCGKAAISGELLVSDDCFCDPRHEHQFDGMQAHGHYIVPLSVANNTLGVLFLYTDPYPAQNDNRLTMLKQVGGMLALAVLQERARTSLEKARDMAMQTVLAKSEFLANMSHEIRTPMNGVLGMLDLLRDTNMSNHQWDLVSTAYTAAEALLAILNDILDLSKLEAGKLEIEQISFNLTELLADICALLAGHAHAKGLELSYFIPTDIPQHWQGDPNRIRQVLTNLIGNAVKFTEQGEVSLAVSYTRNSDGLDILRFEVRDTGLGIAPEVQSRLFQPFSQAESTTARRFGGTGLGLSICKNLVELMGGVIGLDSLLGKGTCFWFTLPLVASETVETYIPLSDNVGKRILIVDDNATNRTILNHYLIHWGFAVGQVDNGKAALLELENAITQNQAYDLLLLDMHMPEMDGLTLAQIITETPTLCKTPRILLSSGGLLGETERLKLGLAQSVLKPVRQSQLFDAITNTLNSSAQQVRIQEKPDTLANYSEKRVLVVEDNKVNQKVIIALLKKLQITPDVADNGQLAMEKLAENCYDLILMDCQMPIMDGYQTTEELRKFEREFGHPHQPVVALTAHVIAGERERCLAAGMDDYLSKPISQKNLVQTLARWLNPQPLETESSLTLEDNPENTPRLLWNKEIALEYLGDDEELLKTTIAIFIAEAPVQLIELKTAFQSQNLTALANIAHTFKGTVSLFSAETAQKCAARLEDAARSGCQTEDYQQLTTDLTYAILDLVKNFRNFVNQNPL